MFCKTCGKLLKNDDANCPSCGASVGKRYEKLDLDWSLKKAVSPIAPDIETEEAIVSESSISANESTKADETKINGDQEIAPHEDTAKSQLNEAIAARRELKDKGEALQNFIDKEYNKLHSLYMALGESGEAPPVAADAGHASITDVESIINRAYDRISELNRRYDKELADAIEASKSYDEQDIAYDKLSALANADTTDEVDALDKPTILAKPPDESEDISTPATSTGELLEKFSSGSHLFANFEGTNTQLYEEPQSEPISTGNSLFVDIAGSPQFIGSTKVVEKDEPIETVVAPAPQTYGAGLFANEFQGFLATDESGKTLQPKQGSESLASTPAAPKSPAPTSAPFADSRPTTTKHPIEQEGDSEIEEFNKKFQEKNAKFAETKAREQEKKQAKIAKIAKERSKGDIIFIVAVIVLVVLIIFVGTIFVTLQLFPDSNLATSIKGILAPGASAGIRLGGINV